MGNTFSLNEFANQKLQQHDVKGKKRLLSEDDDKDNDSDRIQHVKRRRLKSTSKYIYDALFVSGEGSDIVVKAFDQEWKLHRIYLKQAQFFNKMFEGDWKESKMNIIYLQIPDSNVNKNSLSIAFGSLYSDEIEILPQDAVSILAAASLIQLDGLMQSCAEVMIDSVCRDNVCSYYESARCYGQVSVERTCVQWLENNLMLQSLEGFVAGLDTALMARIISSPDMFVVQVEMDVYMMLRKWLFYKVNEGRVAVERKELNRQSIDFFQEKFAENDKAFLETDEGREYLAPFRALRYCNIIRDFGSCMEVESDGIIPLKWLLPLFRGRWLEMLRVEQGIDRGPVDEEDNLSDGHGLRCGRQIMRDADHCWRWNGYNFGVDLLVTYNSRMPRTILLKRNVHSHHCVSSVGLLSRRNLLFNLRVFCLDQKGHVAEVFTTGKQFQSFGKDEERAVLSLGDQSLKLSFPLMVSATFKTVSTDVESNNTIHFDWTP